MKKIIQISFVLIGLMSTTSGIAGILLQEPAEDSIEVLSTKYRNLFVFKIDRELKGTKVEVYYSNGDLVTAHTLEKRKMIIDFCDVKFGTYTIRIKKGKSIQEYQYVKK